MEPKEIIVGEHKLFHWNSEKYFLTDNLKDYWAEVFEKDDYTLIRGKEIDSVIKLLKQAKEIYNKGDS